MDVLSFGIVGIILTAVELSEWPQQEFFQPASLAPPTSTTLASNLDLCKLSLKPRNSMLIRLCGPIRYFSIQSFFCYAKNQLRSWSSSEMVWKEGQRRVRLKVWRFLKSADYLKMMGLSQSKYAVSGPDWDTVHYYLHNTFFVYDVFQHILLLWCVPRTIT